MRIKNITGQLTSAWWQRIHWPLFLFLLIFTIDKILLKFAGIAIIYLLHPDFRFRRSLRSIPLFYPLLIMLTTLQFLLFNRDFGSGHTVTLLLGCSFWFLSFLALYQFRSIVLESNPDRIHRTLQLFFLVNAAISLGNLVLAMIHSGMLVPYRSTDPAFDNSTGDLIKGLFMGPSYLNMMINAFFLFYFLYRSQFRLALFSMFVILLTTSNFGNLVLIPTLILCCIFKNDNRIRRNIAAMLAMTVAFYLLASPHNFRYLRDSIFVPAKRQQELVAYRTQVAQQRSHDSVNKTLYQPNPNTKIEYTPARVNRMIRTMQVDSSSGHLSITEKYGKVKAFKETASYLARNRKALIMGAGIGSFSSFLAERMSGIDQQEGSRLFSHLPTYIAPAYRDNHYEILYGIYGLPAAFHSIKHFPNSFVNQIFGEYGILGFLLFLLTYVLFFTKNYRSLSYGKYLLVLMGAFLLFDYLFEYLSVVCIFELLMLCDLKRAGVLETGDIRPVAGAGDPAATAIPQPAMMQATPVGAPAIAGIEQSVTDGSPLNDRSYPATLNSSPDNNPYPVANRSPLHINPHPITNSAHFSSNPYSVGYGSYHDTGTHSINANSYPAASHSPFSPHSVSGPQPHNL